jgi:hypothetical protein
MKFTPNTTLPIDQLKTGSLLDTLQELCNLHESAMLSTTRVILEQHIALIHRELDTREETNKAWQTQSYETEL